MRQIHQLLVCAAMVSTGLAAPTAVPVNRDRPFEVYAEYARKLVSTSMRGADVMRDVATAHEVSVAQIALAWLLHQTAVTSVIIGAKRLDQLDDNLGSVDLTLTDPELERLNTVSALAPEYPGWMQILQADRSPGTTRNWDKYVK